MGKIFSGIRPSGKLHLGNYLGAIKNWLKLQEEHECIYGIVDLHAITTPFKPDELKQDIKDLILDLLALGLDPKKSTLVIQSHIPEHLELAWIFSSIVKISELNRIPTFKEKTKQHPDHINLGLLSYPVLMAADILIYKADLVPVGEDQLPHIELTNKIGEKFNKKFDYNFPRVKPLLTEGARIMSLKDHSKKMSKTGDEGILLTDTEENIKRKITKAVTDTDNKIKFDQQKKPAISNLLTIYNLLSDIPIKELENKYKSKGYADFKNDLAQVIIDFLKPFQEKRKELESKPDYVEKIIQEGSEKAREEAQKNILEIKKKIGLKN